MMRFVLIGACACALAGCNEPTRTTEGAEGAYGASSGPNANDPDATVAAQDQDPTYDEPSTGTGSEVKQKGGPEIVEDRPQATSTTP